MAAADLPKPPERPDEASCCGRGCEPCIFDYYDRAMARWAERVRALGHDPGEASRPADPSERGDP